jgi:hypothetical protein
MGAVVRSLASSASLDGIRVEEMARRDSPRKSRAWNRLFPGHRPYYAGDNAHDYITARAHRV